MTEDGIRETEEKREGQQTSALLMKGATILVIAGIVSKIFGAIFRIPLTNMIGAEGQAYYSAAYAVYNLLFVIATAGFPVAISRMVSSRIAEGDFINAHKSYKLAMKVSWALGILSFLVMFWGQSYPDHEVLDTLMCNVYAWIGVLGVLSFMKKWGGFSSSFTKWMCRKSWGLYLFHYLGISAVALLFAKTELLPAWACYLLSAVMGFALAYLLNFIIPKIPFFRWAVMGISKKKKESKNVQG